MARGRCCSERVRPVQDNKQYMYIRSFIYRGAYNGVSGGQACPAPPTGSLGRPSSSCTPCRSRPWPRVCRRRNHSHRAGWRAAASACRPRTAGTALGPRGCPPTRMSRSGGRSSPDACGTSSPCASRTCALLLAAAVAARAAASDPLSPGAAVRPGGSASHWRRSWAFGGVGAGGRPSPLSIVPATLAVSLAAWRHPPSPAAGTAGTPRWRSGASAARGIPRSKCACRPRSGTSRGSVSAPGRSRTPHPPPPPPSRPPPSCPPWATIVPSRPSLGKKWTGKDPLARAQAPATAAPRCEGPRTSA